MSSDDIAIKVEHVSKRYDLYAQPSDQLKQMVMPRLRRLAKRPPRQYYNEFWALSDVSLEVRKGEAFGIVGRNGSGKSTLLQIITGTLAPTTGHVETRGRLAALLELGSGFNPDFSGRENIYLNGAILGFTHAEMDEKFDAIASFADIGEHLDQPVRSYSSGMAVRLAMAVQTQVEPDILIVDEALAVGDALFQKKCFRQLDRLADDGCTLLFVSHDQEVVRTLTQRSIFINGGKVLDYGPTTDVLFSYRKYLQSEEEKAFAALQRDNETRSRTPTAQKSYGSLEVEIEAVRILDREEKSASVFYAGDQITIAVDCVCNADMENLNIAFRIRNKEGVKITTWGTLNEDMPKAETDPENTFWNRKFSKGEKFTVAFSGPCSLAANLYEVQVVAALEYDRYYANQRVLHWLDDAAHFTVVLRGKEYVFDGVVDMGLRSQFVRNKEHN